MNLTLAPFVLFVIVLPGVLCRYFFRRGFWRSPVRLSTVVTELYYGVWFSIPIHLVGYAICRLLGWSFDFFILLSLLSGYFRVGFQTIAASLQEHFAAIMLYQIGVISSAILLGAGAHRLIRARHLDLRYKFFRFNNPWYYSFRGESELIQLFDSGLLGKHDWSSQKIDQHLDGITVYVAAVVSLNSADYLYLGELSEFYFGPNGELDRIVLSSVYRRRLENDTPARGSARSSQHRDTFYRIAGNHLILSAKDMRNINVQYLHVE